MKVFISWSGVTSRNIAEALHWWFPKVIQGIMPFVSSKDIDKGANWTTVLSAELEDTSFGVLCLTPDNLTSPWLSYEAGAISSSVESRVCPVLFGVEKEVVRPPFAQLQMTSLEEGDMLEMMRSMNKAAGAPLTDVDLIESASIWWPKLAERIADMDVPEGPAADTGPVEPAKPELSNREALEELLYRVRVLDRRMETIEHTSKARSTKSPAYSWADKIFDAASAEGISISKINMDADGSIAFCDRLPEPLPSPLYEAASSAARTQRQPCTLIDKSGRKVAFDRHGLSDEPPF